MNWIENNEINILEKEQSKASSGNSRILATTTIKPRFKYILLVGEIKYWAYLVSWTLKLVGIWMISEFRKKKKIIIGQVNFIRWQRKIHFVLFNINVLDMMYFGTRSIFHTSTDYKYTFSV